MNLVVGRNNSGKTSLLEAALIARGGRWALATVVIGRAGVSDPAALAALFRSSAAERSFHVAGSPGTAIDVSFDGRYLTVLEGAESHVSPTLEWSGPWPDEAPFAFAYQGAESSEGAIREYTAAFLAGEHEPIVAALRQIEPELESVDVVGDDLWIKHRGVPRRLPFHAMGDGARWMFDLAVTLHRAAREVVALDEVDAGLHHTAVHRAIELLRSGRPTTQVFATTHRDDTIRAACDAFLQAGDDGLRVVRVDRLADGGHRAVVYSAEAAKVALDQAWELRG